MGNKSTQHPGRPDLEHDDSSTVYQMNDAYDDKRLFQWLVDFDDITSEVEPVIPTSLLPGPPERSTPLLSSTSPVPEQFYDTSIILSERSQISDSMLKRMSIDQEATEARTWIKDWAKALSRVKTKQHRSLLRKYGVESTPQRRAHPSIFRTKKAKAVRTRIAKQLFASTSIQAFLEQNINKRMAAYSNKFSATGTIKLSDPAEVGTDVLTQCTSSLSDEHARSFLSTSTLDLLPPKEHAAWKEAYQHFWRQTAFVVNAKDLHNILNTLDARTKRTIGMLHVNIEALDDGFEPSPSHEISPSKDHISNNTQRIRSQNENLRRLAKECYNLTWLRVHIYNGQLAEQIQHLANAHRDCSHGSSICNHTSEYNNICKIVQTRVQYLTWLLYSSLSLPPSTIFIDVEMTSLAPYSTTIQNIHFDTPKLARMGKAVQQARQNRRREQLEKLGNMIVDRKLKVAKGRVGGPVHGGFVEEMQRYIDEVVERGGIADENFRGRFLAWRKAGSA
ncbi:hypothetical protein D6C98_08626 [Aureobasidium pullulans]|nr:hypothetical protein D6D23_10602 [Aureobasidium pullulans]THW18724.1 hypothetical protein D6D24_03229 [Aureobasidium pullulans]THY43277.1 hypothetical protein D6C98_08626 [Aureobasidium pullulans]THZ95320.1 hypothetical protein D6C82_07767 [Aureobasidium pullulans]